MANANVAENGDVARRGKKSNGVAAGNEMAKLGKTANNDNGGNLEEIQSVFAPSADMDLDDGEIDDDERELEAFKRFCFNSVPAKQKAKISLDVNTLKRK